MALSDMEPILDCVNPYDVNPIINRGIVTTGALIQNNAIELQEDSPKKSIKLEMEEFSDLAPYLPDGALNVLSNSIDELNTPVFDRKGFDFTVYENTCNNNQPPTTTAEDPFKFEYELIRMNNNSVLANNNKQQNDFSVYSNELNVQQGIVNNSEIVVTTTPSSVQNMENNNNLLFSTSNNIMDQENIFIIHNNNGNETPMHAPVNEEQISASSIFNIDDKNSVVSVKSNDNQYSNVSSPSNYTLKSEPQYSDVTSPNNDLYSNNFAFETPEDSNSGTGSVTSETLPKLKLSLSFLNQGTAINTPDVIDSVVDLETAFNVFDGFIDEKDITTINIEDIQFEQPSNATTFAGLLNNNNDNSIIEDITRNRKKRRYEDDDDDYIPPSKKTKINVKRKIIVEESSDSDSEYEPPTSSKSKRAVKQAARRTSVSSDHSDASKYRELRDKNNEASRKSRLKRKIKEVTLEKEADELSDRNIKLKAQVEELDKMVNNFRNNLFKIMLKK